MGIALLGNATCSPTKLIERATSARSVAITETSATWLVGVMVTGSASHGDFKHRFPITDARTYMAISKYLAELTSSGARSDLFLHLDLRITWAQLVWDGNCPKASSLPVLERQLEPMLQMLRPTSFTIANETRCYCLARNCSCSASYPSWWEQVHKWARAFEQLVRHENTFVGRPYDFVIKLRDDYQPVASPIFGGSSEATLLAFRALHPQGRAVTNMAFVQPWYAGRCYGQLDWFWVATRPAAAILARMDEAPCNWQRCLSRRYVQDHVAMGCMRNERMLVEWALDHGVFIAALPITSKGFAVCRSHAAGLVNREHPWHRAEDGETCVE